MSDPYKKIIKLDSVCLRTVWMLIACCLANNKKDKKMQKVKTEQYNIGNEFLIATLLPPECVL